jgi:hypothetical protein
MTETSQFPRIGRIDLRALDEPADPGRAGRVISAAMLRSRGAIAPARVGVRVSIGAYSRLVTVAAAFLIIVASATVFVENPRTSDAEPMTVVAEWIQSQRVPTNGELLVAFQGYGL